MNKKRAISTTISAVMIVAVIVAAVAGYWWYTTSQKPKIEEPIELILWAWGFGSPDGLKAALKPFEEENNVIVNVEKVGGAETQYEKMVAAHKAGSGGPDVAEINVPDLGGFWAIDSLIDLSEHGALEYKDQYPSWFFRNNAIGPDENTIYGMPMEPGSPLGFGYRADIFENYGIDVPKTYAEFAVAAEKLHQLNSSIYISDFQWWYLAVGFNQKGGGFFRLHDDAWEVVLNCTENEEVVSFWVDLLERDLVKDVPMWTTEYFNEYIADTLASMAHMNYWMWFVVEETLKDISGKWRIAPILSWDPDKLVGAGRPSTTWAVMKNTEYPEISTKLAIWMSTSPVFYSLDPGGAFPSNQVVRESSVFLESEIYKNYWGEVGFYGGQDIFEVFAKCADSLDEDVMVFGPYFAHSEDTIFPSVVNRARSGEIEWSEVLDIATSEIIEYITQQGGKIYRPSS